ncbi:MAG: hypothetical protein LBE05_07545 [Microbacterium sp.]|jgi:hypothetical protein|nr:hypothetical protein [Microbacterium sp.]
MTTFPALQTYIDRGLLLSLLQQDALVEATDALGQHRWDVDMQQGTLTFTSEKDPARRLATRAHLIASIAPGPRSVLWDWAHPQGSQQGASAALRAAGERDGVRELSVGEVPFPADFDAQDRDAMAQLAHEIGQASVGILGRGPYYSAPVDGGTRFIFLLDAPLPPLTLAAVVAKLPRLLSTGLFRDPRTAVWGLATAQRWSFRWNDDAFSGATLSDGSTVAQFGFDPQGRIVAVNSHAA